ncbi:hypothetical protein LCGC14_1854360 [marine sediment metagenome]|uniref:Uncharacterized protein n=1 Tax=marine sediment metagenome TaxID=412755 RepID=A0A0F9G9B0_9ZZZZ
MPYTFVYRKVNKFDDPVWLLRIEDFDTAHEIHQSVCAKLYQTVGADPHNFRNGKPVGPHSAFMNPVHLGAKWLQTADKFIIAKSHILVNKVGGIVPPGRFTILDTFESETLQWPDTDETEKITLSKWPRGRHWYLKSSTGRIFSPVKMGSLKEAKEVAGRFVSKDRIKVARPDNSIRRFLDYE